MSTRKNANVGQRYLTFGVEGEVYGIPILKVKEILGIRPITPLPQTPASVLGIINLRGLIVPVVDLRLKFGLSAQDFDKKTSIIVLDLMWEGEAFLLGAIVDVVHEVQAIPEENISRLAGLETRVRARYIAGVADTPAGIRILVDADRILAEEELASIEHLAAGSPALTE